MKKIWLMLLFAFAICGSLYAKKINTEGNPGKKIIDVLVITDKKCPFCIISPTEKYLKKILGVINFKIIDYREPKAKKLIRKCNINYLPSFLIPDKINNKDVFSIIADHAKKKDGYLILSKELSGEFMLLDRRKIPSRIDVFFSLYDNNLAGVLKSLKKFCKDKRISFGIHIIDKQKDTPFVALAQREEKERLLAVEMVYPSKFWSYLMKRIDNINSTFWINDMESAGIDYSKIKGLVHSDKIKVIANKSSALSRELGIRDGIVMLVDNIMIFRVYNILRGNLEAIMNYVQ